ncbi:Sec-independent protein translocase protein TatB [Phenylobacterium sp.]|jgi:sec-independent protein translocase protein TatB
MLPEVGGLEYLIIAAVALIVVGPKDLPVMLRKLGQWVGKLRAMAAEFRASFDDMARQSELDELRREVEAMRQAQGSLLTSETAEVNQVLNEIGDSLRSSDIQFHPTTGGALPLTEAPTEPSEAPSSLAAPKPRRRRKAAEAPE